LRARKSSRNILARVESKFRGDPSFWPLITQAEAHGLVVSPSYFIDSKGYVASYHRSRVFIDGQLFAFYQIESIQSSGRKLYWCPKITVHELSKVRGVIVDALNPDRIHRFFIALSRELLRKYVGREHIIPHIPVNGYAYRPGIRPVFPWADCENRWDLCKASALRILTSAISSGPA
ncbi:MAG: hypothetical protein AAB787_00680, partial [Patescibacteria group bacterium]